MARQRMGALPPPAHRESSLWRRHLATHTACRVHVVVASHRTPHRSARRRRQRLHLVLVGAGILLLLLLDLLLLLRLVGGDLELRRELGVRVDAQAVGDLVRVGG